jgi:serine/threonine protein kinase
VVGDDKRTPYTQPIVGASTEPLPAVARVPSLGQLGRYELLSLLAKGGMGEVFLARSRGLAGFEKLVVIKRNLPSIAGEREPLFAEARLVATLQHTNIVQVYDVDTDGPTVFIAMEFLHGQDVRHLLKRSWGGGAPLPLDQAIAIVLAVCAGLHYAHDKRDGDGAQLEIVHRDVSPSNVFVTYDGGVKLIDFGIAKSTALPSETQLGTIKGKPGYMSPEQCQGEPLDRRSDLFCVGILLYELTTGRRAFHADNEYLTYRQICEGAVRRPSELDPSYPPQLEAIVQRLLSKDRRTRHATAQVLGEELARFASERRLDVSQHALGRYMADVFRAELEAWHAAQQSGTSLVEHVLRTTATVPIVRDISIGNEPGAGPSSTLSSSALSIETVPRERARSGGRWRLAIGAGALAAITGAIVIAASSNGRTTAAPAPRVPAATAAPIEPAEVIRDAGNHAVPAVEHVAVEQPAAAPPPPAASTPPRRKTKRVRTGTSRPTPSPAITPPAVTGTGVAVPAARTVPAATAAPVRGPDDPIIDD